MKHGHHKKSKSKSKVAAAFHEVMHNEPSTVSRANVSKKRKAKMRVAIALSKARKAGARIPKAKGSTYYGPIPQDRAPSVHGSVPADPVRTGEAASYTPVSTPVWRY